jgi:hypothetical protein
MKKYGVIYADPPWKFKTYSPKGLGATAEAWYDCLTLVEIKVIKGNFSIIIQPENGESFTVCGIHTIEIKKIMKELIGTGLIRTTDFVITAKSGEIE